MSNQDGGSLTSPPTVDSPPVFSPPAEGPQHPHGLPGSNNMARSPSHESFATDLSLLSLSSLGSDMSRLRGCSAGSGRPSSGREFTSGDADSPTPMITVHESTTPGTAPGANGTSKSIFHHKNRNSLLQVPGESYGGHQRRHETLFEEETDVIRNCSALSSVVLGIMKSFSTGDISSAFEDDAAALRPTVSEVALCNAWTRFDLTGATNRLDYASRSCSTWVAVGDIQSSTSQLPSPQALPCHSNSPSFTAADFVRSVNKKVRQMYIRRRLMSTYKALERLTKSQLNLSDALKKDVGVCVPTIGAGVASPAGATSSKPPNDIQIRKLHQELDFSAALGLTCKASAADSSLTVKDVERDRGKPLTKYERNMMIFNWLQNLDDTSAIDGSALQAHGT